MPDSEDDAVSRSTWDRLGQVPDLDDVPIEGSWLPGSPDAADATSLPPDLRRFHVSAQTPPVSRPPEPQYPMTWSPELTPGQVAEREPQPVSAPETLRRPRRRLRWVSAVIALMALALAGFGLTAWYMWTQVETIDTAGSLSAPSGGFTNYLIVGVDSRDGVDPTLDTAAQIGLGVAGSRSDTMVVLHTGDDGNRLVSLPRDLWVAIDGGPQQAKLNAATASQNGPAALIRTVQSELRIPIHHYLEVDIAGFLSVVDALGGITLDFPAPTCDPKSGLDVRETGAVALSPEQALAYVRSRTYTEFDVNGTAGLSCAQIRSAGLGTVVGNADFGRTERQRLFLLAVFDKISSTRNPVTLLRVLSGLTDGLRVDDTMGMRDAFGLMRKLRGLNAETLSLPVSDFAAPGGASALTLNDSSAAVLDLFR